MIGTHSNRSISFLAFLILIISTGCSQQPAKKSFHISQQPPVIGQDSHKFVQRKSNVDKLRLKDPVFKSAHTNSIWDRLISLYALPEVDNKRIDREVDWFISHPEYLSRVQKRAEPYLHLILEEIESKNIPGELALLPVVESAFKPKAYSSAKAAGLWQFIPSTGRLYGLHQNTWYDGRRDVYASTQAATSYLKKLSEHFDGDWFLALASYNYGRGNVQKSIRRNINRDLPTDYWSLRLPNETRTYVPRLLAVAKIFAHPEEYNIPLQDIPNEPYAELVHLDSQIDLTKAAELANTSMEEILTLNPAFKQWCTAPNGPHSLLIPIDQAAQFRKNLAQISPDQLYTKRKLKKNRAKSRTVRLTKHKVRRGESLNIIAKRYRTSVAAIVRTNRLKSSNNIQAGRVISVPSSLRKTAIYSVKRKNATGKVLYTVKKGDSIWRIAKKFSVSAKTLSLRNNISSKNPLKAGQKLIIATGSKNIPSKKKIKHLRYTVKKGDSLSNISRKFNVSVTDLRKWNSNNMGKYLIPGQKIKVVVDKTT